MCGATGSQRCCWNSSQLHKRIRTLSLTVYLRQSRTVAILQRCDLCSQSCEFGINGKLLLGSKMVEHAVNN